MKEQIEKQAIEEMYKDIYEAVNHNSVIDLIHGGFIGVNTDGLTRELYDDGYRKQSEEKWMLVEKEAFWISNMEESLTTGKPTKELMPVCYCCKTMFGKIALEYKFCPNCGAKMKGGAE